MRAYRIILIIFISLVVGFIAYNSTRTALQSASISQGVTDVVVGVVRPDYPQKDEAEKEVISNDLHVLVRNLAHALEFAALAFFLALLLFTFKFNYICFLYHLIHYNTYLCIIQEYFLFQLCL